MDPFNDDTIHPFTELNLYLNYDELMEVWGWRGGGGAHELGLQEEEYDLNCEDERIESEIVWSVQLRHEFQEKPTGKEAGACSGGECGVG